MPVSAKRKLRIALIAAIFVTPMVLGLYVFTVVWRVSIAMHEYYGRSDLIPFSTSYPKYKDAPVEGSYGSPTFTLKPSGIVVWRQKVNGFQHMLGSALAAYELGDWLADKLFCANEFAEFAFDWNTVQADDLLDRKKDLYNNSLGRKVGLNVRKAGLNGKDAEDEIAKLCFIKCETDPAFFPHFLDPRVQKLTEEQLGCPCLPQKNQFNLMHGK
ncbi:MAG: hypothetical protein KIT34_15155 [Cyanobacteria bacterium TGS_CYA1]|nr:hypothetical protein [Cyanobacteria bacterium TGS_CYA1]